MGVKSTDTSVVKGLDYVENEEVMFFEREVQDDPHKIRDFIAGRAKDASYRARLAKSSIKKPKTRWGELEYIPRDEIGLATEAQIRRDEDMLAVEFDRIEKKKVYKTKCVSHSLKPVEVVRKDLRKIIFSHSAGEFVKVDVSVENTYTVFVWDEVQDYYNEGRIVDDFLYFRSAAQKEMELLLLELRSLKVVHAKNLY